MLKPKAQLNLKNAREYFREHLSVGDYYAGEKIAGEWFGRGAEKLGLTGVVAEEAFLALCAGQNPTGAKLTARKNTVRSDCGRETANRRIFYDFTISPPKSVSLVALYQDSRIIELHNRAMRSMLAELERFAEARVRKSGQNAERVTGNIIAACFRHDTSRELDPHLHTHCVVFNATHDATEYRWKALHNGGMYRAQKFAENLYYHELAKGLRSLGYGIENSRAGFEICGVPASLIERFSKRHAQIDEEARRQEQAGYTGNVKALREQIAHDKRRRKQKESTADRLRGYWSKQLTPSERRDLVDLCGPVSVVSSQSKVEGAVAWADEYLFERRSVVAEHELLSAALARGRGGDFDLTSLRATLVKRGYVRETGSDRLTSREVLRRELEVVIAAHDGRGKHPPLAPEHQAGLALSAEQKVAVEKILRNRDLVSVFSGSAGTGKSRALQEIHRGLTIVNRPVVVLAPQRQQVADLGKEGLPAETLARFLAGARLPRNAVVILDEAGQVGGRDLARLLRLVQANAGRLVLSGDTRQHGAVAASDALRAIEKHAGLKPAILREIRRQDPARANSPRERRFIQRYRAATKAAARGKITESFDRLDRLGCIRECGPVHLRETLADAYLGAVGRQEKVLVVTQTREEAGQVNEAIHTGLRTAGRLTEGKVLSTLRPVDLGEAQKRDPRFYQPGQQACFLQRYGRYAKGDVCEIADANERGLVLVKDGRRSTLSYRYVNRLMVTDRAEMEVSPGDRLQLKFNGESVEGGKLANGQLVTVRRVRKSGGIAVIADDGTRHTLSPTQRVFVRGYAVTSYGSQGKTVDTVLLADAGNSAATNAKQWYVSITRGRKQVVVFTPDKEELRAAVRRLGDRELALDLNADVPMELVPHFQRRVLAGIERHRQHQIVRERARRYASQEKIAI